MARLLFIVIVTALCLVRSPAALADVPSTVPSTAPSITASATTAATTSPAADDDFAPGLLIAVLILFAVVIFIAIVAAVVGVVAMAAIAVLVLFGVLSTSILIGVKNRRIESGAKALFVQVAAVIGAVAGCVGFVLSAWIADVN